jgi:hypothetical protein
MERSFSMQEKIMKLFDSEISKIFLDLDTFIIVMTVMGTVFWHVTLCNPIDVHIHFRGAELATGLSFNYENGDGSSATLVNFYQSTRHYIPQDCPFQAHFLHNKFYVDIK